MASLAFDSPVALFFIVALGWIMWKVFQDYIVGSPLDNVPGPARTSFWKGGSLPASLHRTHSSIMLGNIHEIFNRHAWDFQKRLAEQYGSVVKFHGALGVST